MRFAKVLSIVLAVVFSVLANLDSGLVAYYPFNGNANDASGNGHSGTVYGATLAVGKDSAANGAYSFDGSNDYISLPTNIIGNNSSGTTIAMWVQLNFSSDNQIPFCINGVDVYGAKYFSIYTTGSCFRVEYSQVNCSQPYTFNNSWHHVIGTWNSSTVNYWIDGVKVGTEAFQSYAGSVTSVWLGNAQNRSKWVNGRIDEVRIYNRVMSDAEISTLYNYQPQTVVTYLVKHLKVIAYQELNAFAKLCKDIPSVLYVSRDADTLIKKIDYRDTTWKPISMDLWPTSGESEIAVTLEKGDSTVTEVRTNNGTLTKVINPYSHN
jgi:hypothetical protein